jgi:hypothetical protein
VAKETRSRLQGELAQAVDAALEPGEDIQFEISSYRGHGIVVTDTSLMLVVGGVLAGLKAHEQHIHRIPLEKLESISLETEAPGCFIILGVPPVKLRIKTADNFQHDKKWDTLEVDYKMLSEAAGLIAYLHEQVGRRKQGPG